MSSPKPGSFEYLEANIRRDAEGTLFGRDFEWVCQWYLEHAPLYRGKFRKVWRWAEWPDRWGPDCGVDLIAETHDGKLWAIQAKAVAADRLITKAEIDSFLSESNRTQIAHRLLITTTVEPGPNARRTIDQQEKRVSFVGRGNLLTDDLIWPTKVGGTAPRPARAKPRPHQRAAIAAVLRGFRQNARGRLIMACGTGKTLTGLWIHERLKNRHTLLLVPSISLAQQNLREWGRHASEDFDCLVVCSDESVASDRDDPALRYIAELGIDVTTDPADIAAFLSKRRRRPVIVIATYQSSDRVSKGQRRARKTFDLALCDEAHRLVGDVRGKFATVLDDRKIRCRRRLFMTATPRYFTQRAKDRAADQDLEVASMDDVDTFGPEFHVLKFYDAITAKPTPLLTDYRVVVIGVTNAEAAAWVEEGKFVRTRDGAETDARTLAAQIGLAKAIREYDLRRIITFHRSIRRASRFVDSDRRDSLPAVVKRLQATARPSGKLWARHISGETPASKRASMLRSLAELPAGTRGLIANCACLGEGVDVPSLDGIAFIDPRGSIVDIIQAVGRVIRLSRDKTIGTIVIPVFVDQSADADHAIEQSAFDPVWQVLKALRAHDHRLADELDALRTSIGKQSGGRLTLPNNVILDGATLALRDFEQAFYVRAVQACTEKAPLTIDRILMWADEHKRLTRAWPGQDSGKVHDATETWRGINVALSKGGRGLPGGSSIRLLLHEHRGVPHPRRRPKLSVPQILRWADDFHRATGRWPKNSKTVDVIPGTEDSWATIDAALRLGKRGLRRSSLANLLAKHRGVRHHLKAPPFTVPQILRWADRHKRKTGDWPTAESGDVIGAENEKWANVQASLSQGTRGLPGGDSLARLLERERGVRNRLNVPRLTTRQILAWADAHREQYGEWPSVGDDRDPAPGENWAAINAALERGSRGLPGDCSLAKLLAEKRDVRRGMHGRRLTVEMIAGWATAHYKRTGRWPTLSSGVVHGTNENWNNLDQLLAKGLRGLPGGQRLAVVLAEHCGVRNHLNTPDLTVKQILIWADEHYQRNGCFPTKNSGDVFGTKENWSKINTSLKAGNRGFSGGSSLARLLKKHGRAKR